MKSIKTPVALGAAFALALSLAACSGGQTSSTDDVSTDTSTAESGKADEGSESADAEATESESQDQAAPSDGLTFADAIVTATDRVPGFVVGVEADRDGTTPVWEVIVRAEDGSGTELYIDRATGEIIRERSERLSRAQQESAAVTAQEAIDIALAAAPGELIEAELDTERGALVWSIEVRQSARATTEFYIDANTGEILKQEVDD